MKWSILGLLSLGLLAAVCAAMLVTSFSVEGPGQRYVQAAAEAPRASETTVLVAARPLAALTVLEAGALSARNVPLTEVPVGAVASEASAIGKVLLRSLEQGEVITSALFAGSGSGVHVASALQEGKRAVSVTLSDNMGLEGLLYPGSVVDVLASMSVREPSESEPRPVSMTLLQGVFVLAVGEETVVSDGEGGSASGTPLRQGRRPGVTLLVDAKQAELLKLAMQEGSVSLVLRNPTDDGVVASRGTPLDELSPIIESQGEQRRVVVMKGGQAETRTIRAGSARP